MRYRFDAFVLDTATRSLQRAGVSITLARRAFECLVHLLVHRERAIGRDELIDVLWRRDDVSYNQLAQLVLSVRQALGDSGSSQRVIRTVAGFGYHWVAPVIEEPAQDEAGGHMRVEDAPVQASQHLAVLPRVTVRDPVQPSIPAGVAGSAVTPAPRTLTTRPTALVASGLVSVALVLLGLAISELARYPTSATASADLSDFAQETQGAAGSPTSSEGSLGEVRSTMLGGRFEDARTKLARLPPELAASAQAQLLSIDLHLARGQWALAERGLRRELAAAKGSGDSAQQALLLSRKAQLLLRTSAPAEELQQVAEAILEAFNAASANGPASLTLAGEVARARGRISLAIGELDQALHDLSHARDRFLEAGDDLAAATTASSMARVWMRQGRLTEALGQLQHNVGVFAAAGDASNELLSLNTITRLQLELLAWEGALLSSDRALGLAASGAQSERGHRTRQIRVWVLLGLGRLREAESLIEDLEAEQGANEPLLRAALALEASLLPAAVTAADHAFRTEVITDQNDVHFENREGALLLRLVAAQALRAAGEQVPDLSEEQKQALFRPQTTVGEIALGRWHWQSGELDLAQVALSGALQRARQMNQSQRMRLAGEALIRLNLQEGDVEGAARVLAKLRSHDPQRFNLDYGTSLLAAQVFAAMVQPGRAATACNRARDLRGEREWPLEVEKLCSQL